MTDQVNGITGEITGKLELLPNPCTTKPCLPALAFAVAAEDRVPHFLTRDGKFVLHNAADLPSPGEKVVVVGDIHEQQDVNGKPFKTIQVTSITAATH